MVATHVELAEVAAMSCLDCGEREVREAVLVNQHGLVLLRGTACASCGHQRHRYRRGDRPERRSA